VSATIAPDVDAAMVLGMASTALPFARSPEDQAERWLRILRLHGEAGAALQALGVSEAPLEGAAEHHPPSDEIASAHDDMVAAVTAGAVRVAAGLGAQTVGAGDVLVAVIGVYGEDFERVLRGHGTDRDEVLLRLGIDMPDGITV
jgi:quercetin dioxygenase-like cupin family protein